MNILKTLIIDDNSAAVDDLTAKLKDHSSIEICGSANSFSEGIKQIQTHTPDLLFLDVDMPDKNGFEVVAWLKKNYAKIPYIIFVTGFEEHALKAIKEGALDFIVKPADEIEIAQAINKALQAIENDNRQQKLDYILNYITGNKQLFLPSNTGYRAVNTHDIVYIWKNGQNERVEIVFGENNKLVLPPNYTLLQLQKNLPDADFFQIKRELIVNINFIKGIETYTKDCILQKDDFIVKVQMSRRSLKEFKDRMIL